MTLVWGISFPIALFLGGYGISQEIVTLGLVVQGIGWSLGGAVVNPFLLKITGILPIARLSYFITALLLLITSFMPTFHSFILLYALAAIMGAISLSSTFNLISVSAPDTIQGKVMGIAQSMMSLGFFLVPILGAISGAISIDTFYPISAFFLLVGLCILGRGKK